MKRKLFLILILPALALVGAWFLKGVLATSNPHSWTNGLVGYWSFDGQYTTTTSGTGAGTRDVSNNGNWGAFNGGVKPVGGISGQALSFDGVNDYVSVGAGKFDTLTDGTVEMWVKPTAWGDDAAAVFWSHVKDGNNRTDLKIDPTNHNLVVEWYVVGSWKGFNLGVTPNLNEWHLVTMTFGALGLKGYVDGVLKGSNATTTGFSDMGTSLYNTVGTYGSGQYFWEGLIDEVRIYSRALSAGEVKQHYDQTRRNLQINQPSGTPPVGWWKMDEGTGATVRDSSVNANNGTVSNGGYGATSTDGKIGKALSFDGVDDYVNVPSSSSLSFGNSTVDSPFSIFFWAQSNTVNRPFIMKGIYTNEEYRFFHDTSGKLWFGLIDISATAFISQYGSTVLSSGTWYFLGVTYDGSSTVGGIKLYLNGVAETLTPSTGGTYVAMENASGALKIGHRQYSAGGNQWTNGLIDDVRIYNYARTAEQIANDYRAGAYRTIIATSVPSNWWTNGLVGYWNFDGQNTTSTNGTRDTSGQNNWGAFNGGVKPVAGISGQALSFDGTDDYVDGGTGASLPLAANAFTVEAWIKTTSQTRQGIVTRWNEPPISWFTELTAAGMARFAIFNTLGSTYADVSGITDLQDGNWHHIVGVWNVNVKAEVFVDGILEGSSTTFTGTKETDVPNLHIGKHTDAKMTGLIDEVRIYNRALSADEILQHYQQTRRNLGL